ncbi:maestro heat-like repeat-containing protein family member 7 isoform X2 [Mauremys mutica]|uniref:maestro heat-like repeat-containing protein family member 7 isoform X2 n=1 Tax=Mauremys mutica TaxID=74926 RepID=UPI001D16CC49|nr:maestro heat-like repeat-containing protein family member 7 isoform X2 [Mauremys mutica]XP_044870763.1 maestro heat-like repeat-containing protein family member 7 isoform X2 [Mauremys mutica]XP_044870764.1 maestro heat-like repeat-containing protein family member 7 isoform X2 [Mauremys mutica]XP_044870765.1 maestro heat-like repeat-containing protein family member 7 isoform X2 [Mauremys mutica]XP_044870766.1 maestro heat-like repeat-containing protein family member 7 isoform X2 [Mauremys mut
MAEEVPKGPSKPIRAWEETKPPQRKSWRKSPQRKQELCVPQPFRADSPSYCNACLRRIDWEEKEALEYINAFLTSNEQDEAKKLKFLDSISTLSSLPAFMDKALLVGKIKELIDHESVDSLTGVMRQQAMLAIMKLSKMKLPWLVLTRPSLLATCFSSIFSLPPAHTMEEEVEAALCTKTLKIMDEMLKALVCEDQEPNLLVLQIILKVLLPWTTSKEVHERLRAVGRITWLMEFMGSQCKFQEVEEFSVLGQLVGCLTLCCAEQEQEIWQLAVEGLHHVYSFMLQLKSKMPVNHGAEYRQLLHDSQTERAFWVTNISNITSIFGEYFDTSECMDFLLVAIKGMRDSSIHDALTARNMLHMILEVPGLSLGRVSEAVKNIHNHLDSISTPLARQELRRALLLLGYRFSKEVVGTLLGCSLSCDSVAAEMWKMLTSQPKTTRKILGELVSMLQEPARRQHQLSERPAGVPTLAATRALYVILQEQACRQEVKELFPQLYVALLFHVTHTVQHTASQEREHNQEDTAAPLSPVRFAVKAMEALLLCAGYKEQVTFMMKQGGWDLLMNSDTHHKGVCLLARAMVSLNFQERNWIFHHLMAILNYRDDRRYVPAVALFIQLLQCPDLGNKLEDAIVEEMSRQLRDHQTVVRWLALKGLLNLALLPEKVGKLQRLLPDVLERLQEVDRDLIRKAIAVLKHLLASMDRQSASRAAVQVAEQLLPLFDDVSSKLRVLSITLFKDLLELVRGPNRRQMKEHVLQSLVPLLLLVHDERPNVSQVCWDTLSSAAQFLRWHQLSGLIQHKETWQSCDCLACSWRISYRALVACS